MWENCQIDTLCELDKSEIYDLLKITQFLENKLNYKFSHFYFRKWQSLKGRVVEQIFMHFNNLIKKFKKFNFKVPKLLAKILKINLNLPKTIKFYQLCIKHL